jgi:hypothetical protein
MYAIYVVIQIEVLAFNPKSGCQKVVEYLFWCPRRVLLDGVTPEMKAL